MKKYAGARETGDSVNRSGCRPFHGLGWVIYARALGLAPQALRSRPLSRAKSRPTSLW
jgi:hypothetical protein